VVLDLEGRDPDGVETVHNDLSDPYFLPEVALLLEEDTHAVCARKSVKVREVYSGERETY